jgi:hypothetical protein
MGRSRNPSPVSAAAKIAAELFASTREPTKDSLIVHSLGRAYLAANGWEKSEDQSRAGAFKVNQWKAARVAPKATRVALFITSWAAAMRAEGRDEFTITEYARFWDETERVAYRLQEEFRELWPEYRESNPNELARQIVEQEKLSKDEAGRPLPFSVSVEVTA